MKHVYSILLLANQTTHWQPQDLVPVGQTIQEMSSMINYYESKIEEEEESNTTTSGTSSTSKAASPPNSPTK